MNKRELIEKAILKLKKSKFKKASKITSKKDLFENSLLFMQHESDLDFYSLNPKWEFEHAKARFTSSEV